MYKRQDGGAGQLEYRGYRIEDLAKKSTFTEVAYLLVHGELPTSSSLQDWNAQLARHAHLDDQQNENLLKAFNSQSHPMGMFTAGLAALSTLYPDARDVEDPEIRQKHVLNAIAKVPPLAAAAAAYRHAYSGAQSSDELSYIENFLTMAFSSPKEPFQSNPTFTKALDQLLILHADHEQNCSTTAVRVVGSSLSLIHI